MAARDFRRDLALVRRLVRQHRLADDVADGEDVVDVGAHLLVDGDEAALVDLDARRLRADRLPFGRRPTETSMASKVSVFAPPSPS